jgi:Ring finger domain
MNQRPRRPGFLENTTRRFRPCEPLSPHLWNSSIQMSRDHPIELIQSPEEAARRTVSRHIPRVPLPRRARRRNDTEIIDLAQDDDDDEVIAMDESEEEDTSIGFVGVSHATFGTRHSSSNDTNVNRGVRGPRPAPRGVLARSNAVNQASSSEEVGVARRRSPKRRNAAGLPVSLVPSVAAPNSSSDESGMDASFASTDRTRRRFESDVPPVHQQRSIASLLVARERPFATRLGSQPDGYRGRIPPSNAQGRVHASTNAARAAAEARVEAAAARVEAAAAQVVAAEAALAALRAANSAQRMQIRHNGLHGDFRVDEFETLPPEPEPDPQDLRAIASSSRGTPAPEHIVSQLPVVVVSEDEVTGNSSNNEGVTCAICWDNYSPGDHRKVLPCWHSFHVVCLDQWLAINGCCPLCKHTIQ